MGLEMRLRAVIDPRSPFKLRHLFRPPGIPKPQVARHLPRDPIVVEAGAHIGTDTVEMARIWPDGTIHSFEPVPHVFARLEARTGTLPNVHRHREALGPSTPTVEMWVSGGASDGSSSVLTPRYHLEAMPEVTFEQRIEVPAVTLDALAEREALDRIDFLWLDMQGYELAALESGEGVLTTVRAIVCEVSNVPYYDGMPLWPELRAWLERRGFVVARLNMAWKEAGDALFVRHEPVQAIR
jgi:FkbM family methyltransferase